GQTGGDEDHLTLHGECPAVPRGRVGQHQAERRQDEERSQAAPVGLVPPSDDGDLAEATDDAHQSSRFPWTIGVGSFPVRYWRMCRATGAATPPPEPPSSSSTTTTYFGLSRGVTPTNQAWLSLVLTDWPVPVLPPTWERPSPKLAKAPR